MKRLSANVFALVAAGLLGVACGHEGPRDPAPPANGAVDPNDVPFDVQEVIEQVRLAYQQDGESFSGTVRNLDIIAERGAVTMIPHRRAAQTVGKVSGEIGFEEGSAITFETIAIERDKPFVLGHETFLGEDSTLRIDRRVAEERFVNRADSVEQLWVFEREPAGTGDLRVLVGVDGEAYVGWDEEGHHFMDEETGLGVRYGNATWIDAAGRRTDVPVEYADGVLAMTISERLVASSAYPAVLDPIIGAEIGLTAPVAGAAAAFHQNAPAVAFDGTNFLVVWEDQRDSASYDIYGARISQTNVLLDPVGILIASAPGDQRRPAIAFNGTNYLVTWSDFRNAVDFDLYAGRVSPAGAVLDGVTGFAVAVQPDAQDDSTVTAAGATWLVAWRDRRSGVDNIYATRVDAGAGVTPPNGFALEAGATVQEMPSAAASSTTALVAFVTVNGTTRRIRATRIDMGTGTILGTGEIAASGSERFPSVAFGAGYFFVAYERQGQGALRDINAVRVNQDGTLRDPLTGFIVNGLPSNQRVPSAAFRNNLFLVAWHDDRNAGTTPDIYGTTVTPAGVVNSPNGSPINVVNANQSLVAVAAGSTGWFAAWEDLRGAEHNDIYGTNLTNAGNPTNSSGVVISASANRQTAPAIVWSDPYWLIVYADSRRSGGSDYDIKGVRIRRTGAIADPSGLNISVSPGIQAAPHVAYNPDDDEIFVVYTDQQTGDHDIRGRILNPNFSIGPERIIATGPQTQQGPRVAYNAAAGRYLVIWQDNRAGANDFDIYATRIDNVSGTVVDAGGSLVISAVGHQRSGDVASDGLNWLVVWNDERNGTTEDDIRGAIVNFANTVTVPDIAISAAANEQGGARVAFDGTNYVVVWNDARVLGNADVFANRVTSAGVPLDGDGFGLATTALEETGVGITILDSAALNPTWFLVWSQDVVAGSQDEDLYGRQFTTAGVPVAPAFAISTEDGDEGAAAVSFGRTDRAMVAYQRFDATAGVNQERVFARMITFP